MRFNHLTVAHFTLIYSLELVGLLLNYSPSFSFFLAFLVWIFFIFLRIKQAGRFNIKTHPLEFFVGISITFSLSLWPFIYNLAPMPIDPSSNVNYPIIIYLTGKALELIFFPSSYFKIDKLIKPPKFNIPSIPNFLFHTICVLFIIVSLISWKLGISLMGEAPKVILPFKLNGILNLSRIYFFPLFFIFFLNHFLAKNNLKKALIIILYFLIFSLTESLARTSRGVFFYNFILIGLCFIQFLKSINVKIFLGSLLVMFSGLFIYIFISSVRIYKINPEINGFQNAWNYSFERVFRAKFVYDGATRLFGGGKEINAFLPYVDPFFGDYKKIKTFGGAANFNTKIIDKAESAFHNSGITFIGEIFLYSGIVGILLSFFLLRLTLDSVKFFVQDNKLFITIFSYYLFIVFNSGLGFFNLIQYNFGHFLSITASVLFTIFVDIENKNEPVV